MNAVGLPYVIRNAIAKKRNRYVLLTTRGSAVSTSSQIAWACSMTGRRQVKRSMGKPSPEKEPPQPERPEEDRFGRKEESFGARVTVSLPHSTLRVDEDGKWT